MGEQRVRIGLVFDYNENWIGGTYYILNLIHALNQVDEDDKPTVVVFCNKTAYFERAKNTGYPYLELQIIPQNSKTTNRVNTLSQMFLGRNLLGKVIDDAGVDVIFPYDNTMKFQSKKLKKLFWIPDFQELHLPHLFLKRHLLLRNKSRGQIINTEGNQLVLSSESAHNDLKKFYTKAKTKVHVLPFAVTHPNYNSLSIDELLTKYELPKKYFFSPNQFWIHKNQMHILKAVVKLKDKHPDILVAFTGKEYDNRNPGYFDGLKDFIQNNGIGTNIKFLGFIDRKDQLKLMSNSVGVIQPSLFEGWSTVVEDSKAMNQFMIASNLDVHKEQLLDTASFFDPHNVGELVDKMADQWENPSVRPEYNYSERVKAFGLNFLSIIKRL